MGSFNMEEEAICANYVFLGGGSLGSTKVLLRSKERGLNISPTIGTHFSTNGDVLAFSHDGERVVNSIGVRKNELIGPQKKESPGPCITTVMDMREQGGKLEDNFVIEDGTPPTVAATIYSVALPIAAKVNIHFLRYSLLGL